MIGLEDRQALSQDIDVAHAAGARLHLACEIVGIDLRTLQRWKAHAGLVSGDGRPLAVRPLPSHALSEAERAELLRVANEPRFAAVPPARIVPMLADDGVYLASESTFSRVLRDEGQAAHRGRAKKPRAVRPPTTHIASAPKQVWCWDMTYLPAAVVGMWFHLYLILDLYSRKIVGWEVHATDDSVHAAHLVRRTALAEGIATMLIKPVLHGDNGSTLKATTVLAMLYWLFAGVVILFVEHSNKASAAAVNNLQSELPELLNRTQGSPTVYWSPEQDQGARDTLLSRSVGGRRVVPDDQHARVNVEPAWP